MIPFALPGSIAPPYTQSKLRLFEAIPFAATHANIASMAVPTGFFFVTAPRPPPQPTPTPSTLTNQE